MTRSLEGIGTTASIDALRQHVRAIAQKGDLAGAPYPNRVGGGSDYMTPIADTRPIHVRAATVQLIERHGDVRSGTLGHVIGRFARENPTYLVSFGCEGVLELRGDEITAGAVVTPE